MPDSIHPCCRPCYNIMNPKKHPHRILLGKADSTIKRCAWCGKATYSGILIQADLDGTEYPLKPSKARK